ncbi:MAG: tRNA (adenosine(37)-N6)-threonylcarbamoyltransferase complex ATPase subunit type 1 TsaE, partial [Moorea sp. SIO4G2]|nr:tRNA (adenosine(37)-N6)-threonylcarbamoyltransferase complex ATPase subunit type 1 TsaE [Moorena sp. SIO4G2]
ITDAIVSPTFTLINEYTEGRIPLYHLDLYRLSTSEVESLNPENYWEAIEVAPGIVAIEWAERLHYFPASYLHLRLTYSQDGGRQAQFTCNGQFDLTWLLDRLSGCSPLASSVE